MKHIKQYNTKDNTYNKLYDIISINGRLNIEKLLIYKTNINRTLKITKYVDMLFIKNSKLYAHIITNENDKNKSSFYGSVKSLTPKQIQIIYNKIIANVREN